MTTTGQIAFDGIWDSLPDARVQLRIGTQVITKAISSGLNFTRESTDQGVIDVPAGTVRFLQSAEQPQARFDQGKVIEVQENGSTEWKKMRIENRAQTSGVVSLAVVGQYE